MAKVRRRVRSFWLKFDALTKIVYNVTEFVDEVSLLHGRRVVVVLTSLTLAPRW
jgi:hypothetical protein